MEEDSAAGGDVSDGGSSWTLGQMLADGGRAESDLVWIRQPSAGRGGGDSLYKSHDGQQRQK
jgi:hypothetical protein